MRPRVIPVLLIDEDKRLIKTRCFKDPIYLGDPQNAVRIFNEKEVDEIIFLDICKSKKRKIPDISYLKRLAGECFMPTCYGGGIKSLKEIENILLSGFERVSLNSEVLNNRSFLSEATKHFGSSTIVVSIDVIKDSKKNIYCVYDHVTGRINNSTLDEYVKFIELEGAGEILLNAVFLDGTNKGYDTTLISNVCSSVKIPVIACGGASNTNDFLNAVKAGASAVAAGKLFVLYGKHNAALIQYPSNEELNKIFDD